MSNSQISKVWAQKGRWGHLLAKKAFGVLPGSHNRSKLGQNFRAKKDQTNFMAFFKEDRLDH
jgi:hypothetical protein